MRTEAEADTVLRLMLKNEAEADDAEAKGKPKLRGS
jgi:hypothetical protein